MMLLRLASHYYRADFSEQLAKELIKDFIEDLAEYSLHDVEAAIMQYRRDPKNKRFPTPGMLRDLTENASARRLYEARTAAETASAVRTAAGQTIAVEPHGIRSGGNLIDTRPIMWWFLRKRFWKSHWRVDDIPEDQRPYYDRWVTKVGHEF